MLKDNALCVLDVYEVEGDIDMSVGNVEFNGHVVVHGNVLDDFTIKCKSIIVHGTVGAAFIHCGADAHFLGGVHGNERGRIRVEGTTVAKYLNEADLQSRGDIVIEGGVSSSRVTSWGRLQVERIIGGNIAAMGGIQTNYLGSDLGIETSICLGEHPARKKLATRIDDKLSVLAGDSSSQKVKATAMNANQKQQDTPIETETDNESDRSETVRQHWTELAHLQKELARITSVESNTGVPQLNIMHHIYGDVIVTHRELTLHLTHPQSGQRSVRLAEENRLELAPYKPLPRRNT